MGVACGNTRTGIAMPVCVLPAHEVFSHAPSFRRVVEDHEPDVLVVGRPLTMQGEPGPQAQKLTEDAQAQVEQKWETFQENTQKLIAMHAELQTLLRRD